MFADETVPSKLYSLLNKYVQVKLKSTSKNTQGWVYTIDPVSMSVVLASFLEGKPSHVQIINGEEVEKVEVIKQLENNGVNVIDEFSGLFRGLNMIDGFKIEYSEKRMHDMVEWMRKNHLPVRLERVEDGFQFDRINILDSVFIKAPFTSDSCESTNEIILDKVRLLINSFPDTI